MNDCKLSARRIDLVVGEGKHGLVLVSRYRMAWIVMYFCRVH